MIAGRDGEVLLLKSPFSQILLYHQPIIVVHFGEEACYLVCLHIALGFRRDRSDHHTLTRNDVIVLSADGIQDRDCYRYLKLGEHRYMKGYLAIKPTGTQVYRSRLECLTPPGQILGIDRDLERCSFVLSPLLCHHVLLFIHRIVPDEPAGPQVLSFYIDFGTY